MPAATNLGSYSDKSNFFSRPASVCGCFAPPPPPTLPPKMPQLAGPPSSPQEMSNILCFQRTGYEAYEWVLRKPYLFWRVATDAIDALRAAEAARLASAVPGCCPNSLCSQLRGGTRTKMPREPNARGAGPGPLPGAVVATPVKS